MAIAEEERTEAQESVTTTTVGLSDGTVVTLPATILESVAEESELLEAADGKVSVTLIKPGWSKNGNYYSRHTLEQAVPKFEGSLSFVNHQSKADQREHPNRDIRDLAGLYEGVHVAADGSLRANLKLIGKNGEELRPIIAEAITMPDLIGLSINAAGNLREGLAEGRKGKIVEDIMTVASTDIVTNPSAGGRFEHLLASDDWVKSIIEETSFEQWQENHPDWKPKEVSMEDIKEQVAPLLEEATRPFREQLEALTTQLAETKRRESARVKLDASQVPSAVRSDLLEQVGSLDEEAQDAFIEKQVEMFKKLNIRPLVTGAGQGNPPETTKISEQVATQVLGIGVPMVKPGESVWEYQARMREQG